MPPNQKLLLILVAALLLLAAAWLAFRPAKPAEATAPGTPPASSATAPNPLTAASVRLRSKPAAPAARQTLADLRATLAAMSGDEAVAWIETYLTSGEDQSTGLEFEIGPDGTMTGWPTFRTFLLDALLTLDPAAAARISRGILTEPTTADEWALALRNIGRVETGEETASFLRERTEALIANPAWQAKPSVGYLNAFDVLVHTRATASTPLLSGLIQNKERKDLAHAAFLTLDRLVQRDTVAELTLLGQDRALQQSRPEMTAQQFARADLRDPAQQTLVKAWLLDPARTPTELRSFAGVYPNTNRFVSHNLLTTESAPTGSDLAAHDREALALITAWQADPAFQPIAEHLATMIARLKEFTGETQDIKTQDAR
ncbi:MAG: hypothetical protein K9N23_10020 [Akkermansiaceae bacterium]|nr:hypothetical protein [Akkermansiaceae bacterium]